MNKVAFITGSRADYGIVRKYLSKLEQDKEVCLNILVTGSLLDPHYGHQVDLIYQDGFHVDMEVDIQLDTSSNDKIIHSMAIALDCFGSYFAKKNYDLLIVLGDRYEVYPVVIAAAMQKIPILHLHGGEATFANYDEFIRHSITKMSSYHFTSTETYRKRVIQLGEQPDTVFNLGALGAENCMWIDEKKVSDEVRKLKKKQYFVVLFHPETLTDTPEILQVTQLINAVSNFPNYQFIFIGSNADTNADIIRQQIKIFTEKNQNTIYYENLNSDSYHYLLKHSIALVGNSSSGIIEAPSLQIPTVNIGHRQDGRVRGKSVIDVECTQKQIVEAIQKTIVQRCSNHIMENPYYKPHSAQLYYEKTKWIFQEIRKKKPYSKVFFDL